MDKGIEDLFARHDADSLVEIMTGGDDAMLQVDAAEALIKLGDKRGWKFLLLAENSQDKHLREFAEELLDSPEMKGMHEAMEAEEDREHEARIGEAKKRLQKGRKVFRYKVVFIPAEDLLQEDLLGGGIDLFDLSEAGLEGWEVVNLVARRQFVLDINDKSAGAYALLKKEIAPEESADLDVG